MYARRVTGEWGSESDMDVGGEGGALVWKEGGACDEGGAVRG